MRGNVDVDALKLRIDTNLPMLNEYQRRRYLATEAKALGRGGKTLVSNLSGEMTSNVLISSNFTLILHTPIIFPGICVT